MSAGLFCLCCLCALAAGVWRNLGTSAEVSGVQRIGQALVLESPDRICPALDAPWRLTTLPERRGSGAAAFAAATWYRMAPELHDEPTAFHAILLPYLSGGGQVWVNGRQLADIPGSTAAQHVRWERPHLVTIAPQLLHSGVNELWVHAIPVSGNAVLNFPQPRFGPLAELQPAYDRRLFWVRTVPQFTMAACLIGAAFVMLIWWRLPDEALYGWFALAMALWGIRTLTFVLETAPTAQWALWRLVYLAASGGFIVVLSVFGAHVAGVRHRWAERGLLLYWLAGPAWLLVQGPGGDEFVNKLWTAGLVPIALGTAAVWFRTAWRERSATSLLLPCAFSVAVVCGIHDYLLAWRPEWLRIVAPDWTGERYFLLHYGANLTLLAMGALLSTRFVRSVKSLRDLNQTLESRVAEREKNLADHFVGVARLERQNAAAEERRLIMREIHDGLGSKLFTSLSRVERGAMDGVQMAASLRSCISDMRLALDALAPDDHDHDLLTAFGDFMFRWQAELEPAGIRCVWTIDVSEEHLRLPPHTTLQLLRVAQEALTNVAKHSRASRVDLSLQHRAGRVSLRVCDDGIGAATVPGAAGRGLHNMRARASQLGGTIEIDPPAGRGTVVVLNFPVEAGGAS